MPDTILSNDVDEIVAFASRFESVAVKSQGSLVFGDGDQPRVTYTQRCTAAELRTCGASLARAPVLVQAYIDKVDELRITCVDEAVFACRIDSQASPRTATDWRRYDLDAVQHSPVELSPGLESALQQFMSRTGLRYAAFDLIRGLDGRDVFLEVNPSGQFLWIERLTNLPISAAIAQGLVR